MQATLAGEDARHLHCRYQMFDTAAGRCAVAWSEHGITRLQLPESDSAATERRIAMRGSRATSPLPHQVTRAIVALQRYFAGRRIDFTDVALDLGPTAEFQRRIYDVTRALAWGETASYGELAGKVGSPGAARAVGQAMAHNPVPIIIPCHRVLASGRRIGGFSAFGGAVTKQRLLALEGVSLAAPAPLLELMGA